MNMAFSYGFCHHFFVEGSKPVICMQALGFHVNNRF